MAPTEMALQVAILVLALASFVAIQYFPKRALTKLRTKNRSALQSNRHYIQGTRSLARAKFTTNKSQSQTLAKTALAEAEMALTLSPKDPAPIILKALALDLLGHKGSALKSLDLALSSPRAKALAGKERGDALIKRAELKMAVKRRRRVDSAIEDLKEAITTLGPGIEGDTKAWAYCLLGQCYERKEMRDEAKWAFQEAIKTKLGCTAAREGMDRLGS